MVGGFEGGHGNADLLVGAARAVQKLPHSQTALNTTGTHIGPRHSLGSLMRLPAKHDEREHGSTEPHARHSTFLLSSGGAGGGYY